MARILVVEDERIVALDIAARLKAMGYEVVDIASTGGTAIAAAEQFAPDLVLMDVILRGDMDGIEAAQRIRDRLDLPVVYLTAYADDETLHRAKLTSPFGYVLKPFEERELQIAIEIAIYKHQMERELATQRGRVRTTERNLKALIENTADSVWSVDRDYRVLALNTAFQARYLAVWGSPIDVGMRVLDAVPEPARARWRQHYDRALGGEVFRVEESFAVGEDAVVFEVSFNPIPGEAENTYEGVGVFARDITAYKDVERTLREAKQRAEEMSRLKDSILANMSHEIRTPMTAILGFSELLTRRLEGSELEQQAQMIYRGGKRLLELLNNIIDLAKIEANKLRLEPQPHPLAETIRQVVDLLGILAERKGVAIRTYLDTNLIVHTDPSREQQILTNVLGNAIRFTQEGSITITANREPNSPWGPNAAIVRVRDTGVGIAADFLPHIFDEFRQESEGLSREFEGSGLGLAISRKLVERMGGAIEIESAKGEGTTVTIVLPGAERAAAGPPATDAAEPAAASLPAKGRRVLLVEDDPGCAQLVRETLGGGHEVVVAADAPAGLEQATRAEFDVVLLDIHFRQGDMDGIELLQHLRELERYAGTPIYALTAYAMKGDEERFLAAGFDGYIAKPFDGERLRSLIGAPPDRPVA